MKIIEYTKLANDSYIVLRQAREDGTEFVTAVMYVKPTDTAEHVWGHYFAAPDYGQSRSKAQAEAREDYLARIKRGY